MNLLPITPDPDDGRTLIDLRDLDLQPKDLQHPTQAEIDAFAFALAERRFKGGKP